MTQEIQHVEIDEVHEVPEKKCVKAAIKGRLTSRVEMKPLDDFYRDYRAKEINNFIFDLSKVTFLCSTSLSKLAHYIKDVEEVDGKVLVYGVQKEVLHIIQLVNLHHKINICSSFDEALEAL